MEIRIQVIVDNDEGTRRDITRWDRTSLASETLGLQLDEAMALLQASQKAMICAQVEAYLAKQAGCPHCGRIHRLKGRHEIVVRSLFGTLRLGTPRPRHCSCRESSSPSAGKSFSPLAAALPDRTLPERLYLESKWASLVSYGVTARLLEDVLPLDGQVNSNGVRRHTHRVARRCEEDLLAEPDAEPRAKKWPTDNIPPPKPAMTPVSAPRFVVVSDKVVDQWILLQITRASVTSHQAMPVRPDGGANLKNEHFLSATQAVTTRRAWWRCWLGHSGLSYRCWPHQASLRVSQHPASTQPAPEIDLAR
jgi:hypothetical protein